LRRTWDTRKALIAAALLSALIAFIIYLPALVNGCPLGRPTYVYENLYELPDLAFLKRASPRYISRTGTL
jgi:hypothetical protein